MIPQENDIFGPLTNTGTRLVSLRDPHLTSRVPASVQIALTKHFIDISRS
jgi:hypothetical protein